MFSRSRCCRADLIALSLSVAAIFASYLVASRVYECRPHVKDETAYVWQAQVYARGQLTINVPNYGSSFPVPYVVSYQGQRFAKYPPGWPVVLAAGTALGIRGWVNPLLAGLAVWLTYRLGQKLFGDAAGLLAAFLTVTSPFFLMITGSLLAHTWSLFLTLAFSLAWLDTFPAKGHRIQGEENNYSVAPGWITMLLAGLSLGTLTLTRPLTSLGVVLVFLIHALILVKHGDYAVRARLLCMGLIAVSVAALVLVWQFAVTGNWWLNPYTLWSKYDRVGFGLGHGPTSSGHSLQYAWLNLNKTLQAGQRDLFGWGQVSWLFLPAGLWAIRRNHRAWLIAALPFGFVLVYLGYWFGSTLYGPRYYFEGLPGLTLTTSAGMLWILDWSRRYKSIKGLIGRSVTLILIFGLVGYNLLSFLPHRLNGLHHRYSINYSQIEAFQSQQAKALTPAIVLVEMNSSWKDYEMLLDLQNPWLTSPFIFALSQGRLIDEELAAFYADRTIIYYYTDQPDKLYVYRRPEK